MRSGDAYNTHFSKEGLEEIYARDVAGRTAVGKDRVTPQRLGDELDGAIETILRKADGGSYRFTNYRQLLVSKGLGKNPREICIPSARDMLVLAGLKAVLADVLGQTCQTPRPQPVIARLQQEMESGRFDHFMKIDVEEFYHSIDHQTLMHILRYRLRIRKPEVLKLIRAAISTPSSPMDAPSCPPRKAGLPEGLPISNILANAYMSGLDKDCASNSRICYFRYVDDIVILCDSAYASTAKRFVRSRLDRLGLNTNPNKRSKGTLRLDRLEYLGYVFDGAGVGIRRSSVLRLEQRIESLVKQCARGQQANRERALLELSLVITGCIWQRDGHDEQRYGWAMYYAQTTDYACFVKLDRTLKKMDARYKAGVAGELPRFRRVYFEVKYRLRQTTYIPRYGHEMPTEEKRRILAKLGVPIDGRDESWIDRVFTRRLLRLCRKLDRDVGAY